MTARVSKTKSTDQIDRYLASVAKKDFVTVSVNMGWQLAVAILLPVFIGVKLDDRFNTTPSYTLAALVLATGGAVFVVAQNIKQVAKSQAKKKRANS